MGGGAYAVGYISHRVQDTVQELRYRQPPSVMHVDLPEYVNSHSHTHTHILRCCIAIEGFTSLAEKSSGSHFRVDLW